MALFTKQDRELPLLTQYYQLEYDWHSLEGSELDEWVNGLGITYGHAYGASRHKELREFFGRLATLQPLFKRMMESAADEGRYARTDLSAFAKHYETRPQSVVEKYEQRPPEGFGQFEQSGDYVLAGLVQRVTLEGVFEREKPLKHIVIEMDRAILDPTVPFRRCEQCRSVFLVERRDQVYCSRRCNNRSQAKRKREREKIKGQPFVS